MSYQFKAKLNVLSHTSITQCGKTKVKVYFEMKNKIDEHVTEYCILYLPHIAVVSQTASQIWGSSKCLILKTRGRQLNIDSYSERYKIVVQVACEQQIFMHH